MVDESSKRKSRKKATDLMIDVAADGLNSIVPAVGSLAKLAFGAAKESRQRRVEELFRALLTGSQPFTAEDCRRALEDEPMCPEVVLRLLEDEEGAKAWAYAALFRAFARGIVEPSDRIRYLRCLRELTNEELRSLPRWMGLDKFRIVGPYVEFRVFLDSGHREWFFQPELQREEAPHLIEALSRWGFIRQVHERGEQKRVDPPGPGGRPVHTAFRPSRLTIPIPGQTRMRVSPDLALFFFIVTETLRPIAQPDARPTSLWVRKHGSLEDPGSTETEKKDLKPG